MTEDEKRELGPGTWEYDLQQNFNAFTDFCWQGLDSYIEESLRIGHENKISKIAWREYVIYDMQRRHEKEKNKLA